MHVFDLIVGALALIGLLTVVILAWTAVEALATRYRGDGEAEALWEDDDLPENAVERTHAYAEALEESREWMMMTPDTLELDPRFAAAVEGRAGQETPVSEVVDLARHPDGWTASIALPNGPTRASAAFRATPTARTPSSCGLSPGTLRHRRSAGSWRAPTGSSPSTSSSRSGPITPRITPFDEWITRTRDGRIAP
jgi:hypothetical protein